MAGPSFKPGQYEKLSKLQKAIYWGAVCIVFLTITCVWLYKLGLFT